MLHWQERLWKGIKDQKIWSCILAKMLAKMHLVEKTGCEVAFSAENAYENWPCEKKACLWNGLFVDKTGGLWSVFWSARVLMKWVLNWRLWVGDGPRRRLTQFLLLELIWGWLSSAFRNWIWLNSIPLFWAQLDSVFFFRKMNRSVPFFGPDFGSIEFRFGIELLTFWSYVYLEFISWVD